MPKFINILEIETHTDPTVTHEVVLHIKATTCNGVEYFECPYDPGVLMETMYKLGYIGLSNYAHHPVIMHLKIGNHYLLLDEEAQHVIWNEASIAQIQCQHEEGELCNSL